MCGIAAIFAYGEMAPPVDPEEIGRMTNQMAARGPDGSGAWFSGDRRVGLGHRRLSIIDLSPASDEPLFNADGSLAIVFNGEIYNYRELRADLSNRGYQFKSQGDAEVILGMYETRGLEATMNALRGMYAFAIWDQRKGGMLLARDPFGIKPLYYSDNGHTIRLASQVKALRSTGKIDMTPDPAGHVGYFLWGHVPDPFTAVKSIRTIPAGSTMWIDRSGARTARAFCNITQILREAEETATLELGRNAGEGAAGLSNRESRIENRRELLRNSLAETVRYHMVADVPVGVFLSSGLDSTTIAALAAEQGANLRTVTLGFAEYKGTASDETLMAEDFARLCGANHQTIWVSRADFEAERDHLFEAMDRPSIDGVNTFFVSLAAKKAGLKVALSGVGGDEIFGTYPSFRDVPRTVRFARTLPFLPNFGREFRWISAPVLKRFTSPKYAGLFEYGGNYSGAYLLRRGLFMPWELPDLLDPDVVREGWAELQTLLRLDETLDGLQSPRLKVSAMEMQWYMRHQLLRDSDWAGMGHSLEIRVPFVDLEFIKQLGPLLARPEAPSKRDMAAAASPLMTAEILDRRKTGFQIPVREWLLADQPAHAIDSPHRIADRGLRGWSRYVYRRFGGMLLRESRKGKPTRTIVASSASPALAIDEGNATPNRILIFRIGQLGDTIVALPAMALIRKSFPQAHIALLCDRHPGKTHVVASSLLRGSRIFDEYLSYPVAEASDFWRKTTMATLLANIRAKGFDTLVYLAPTGRTPEQIARDHRFFKLAGIQKFIGMRGFKALEPKEPGHTLRSSPLESELLLLRLAASGLEVAPEDSTRISLGLGAAEEAAVESWLDKLPSDGGRRWVAVGPVSKMPSKRWPLNRFEDLGKKLIDEFDIWPVVFGGEDDAMIGDWLLEKWGRGFNAAGALGIRSSLAAMKRCALFVGNDTGTMHMAAAMGLRCVAIFSARERPGLWYPLGEGHKVFRTTIDCEGCGLVECLQRANECLKKVQTTDVLGACSEILKDVAQSPNRTEPNPVLVS